VLAEVLGTQGLHDCIFTIISKPPSKTRHEDFEQDTLFLTLNANPTNF
jgi:hypothetical protein